MKREVIEKFIEQLDGMIAALDQAVVIGGRTKKEREANDLLKEARLKLIEDLESRKEGASHEQSGQFRPAL